jgi:RimJ/RimL family protein N-acetyltransferase
VYPRDEIRTERLLLVPMKQEQCAAILAADLSVIQAGEGWPMDETLVSMRTAERHGVELPGWFITLDGLVIGEAFTHGEMDEDGIIELGYNLAESYRGRRYASEFVSATSQWLLRREGVRRVTASGVEVGNVPSRRALERAGFVLMKEDDEHAWYALDRSGREEAPE